MATLNALPNGNAFPNDWVLDAGATKAAAVAPPDDDDTTTIHSTSTNNTFQAFTCDTAGLSSTDTITAVKLICRIRRNAAADSNFTLEYSFDVHGGGSQSNTSNTLSTSSAGYENHSFNDAGLSALFGGNMRIRIDKLAGGRLNLTTFYAEITYTPAGAAAANRKLARARLSGRVGGLLTA